MTGTLLRDAERIDMHVDNLVNAQITKYPIDGETARWVAQIGDVLAEKFSHHQLIPARSVACLEEFIEGYIKGRTDLKPRTTLKLDITKRHLVDFFGKEKRLREITAGDAEEWRIALITKKLRENTLRKYIQIAQQFFSAAMRKGLIDSNPFSHLKSTTLASPEKFYFVTRSEADAVLDACPDAQWRLIFALGRFGGFRCPSEHLALRWEDIAWENDRMVVHSSKTEHHLGRASRTIPLFPELKPLLLDALVLADPDDPYVIQGDRDGTVNWRTGLQRIMKRAGVKPWPKLFQNLRSTRETELARDYPMHVVCDWIGNSQAIAAKHYLQVTEDDFQKATQNPTQTVSDTSGWVGHENEEYGKTSGFSPPVTSGP